MGIAEIQQVLVDGGEQNYGAEHARVKWVMVFGASRFWDLVFIFKPY